ncbi:hypothetical protein B484DRAFT_459700 [Ochromonadaceae sp. CCMP2298]|nr:hypothetical protein B484DRAFT_459700 [Ochromonadaceae sp. CCMP2298]
MCSAATESVPSSQCTSLACFILMSVLGSPPAPLRTHSTEAVTISPPSSTTTRSPAGCHTIERGALISRASSSVLRSASTASASASAQRPTGAPLTALPPALPQSSWDTLPRVANPFAFRVTLSSYVRVFRQKAHTADTQPPGPVHTCRIIWLLLL